MFYTPLANCSLQQLKYSGTLIIRSAVGLGNEWSDSEVAILPDYIQMVKDPLTVWWRHTAKLLFTHQLQCNSATSYNHRRERHVAYDGA